MQLNPAQELLQTFFIVGGAPGEIDKHIDYKAPHAYRATPKKPHKPRYYLRDDEDGTTKKVFKRKLFKGWRA